MFRFLTAVALLTPAYGFVVPTSVLLPSAALNKRSSLRMLAEDMLSRVDFLSSSAAVAGSAAALALPRVASAGETTSEAKKVPLTTTKLGGQLEPFADVSKGYRLAKPLGWNRYDGTAGEYVVKMIDLVDPTQVILLTNSPVKSDTELSTLGSLETVAEKLSKGRGMELMNSRDRITENVRLYDFEFKDGNRREMKTLTVYKNKLWNLTLGCPEKAWPKLGDTYKTIVTSFLPKL